MGCSSAEYLYSDGSFVYDPWVLRRTASARTAPWIDAPPAAASTALTKAAPAAPAPSSPTTDCATTESTPGARSVSAAPARCTLGAGYANCGTRILALADDTTVTTIELETGEILSTHTIDPTNHYWRNTQRAPGRWPGAPRSDP